MTETAPIRQREGSALDRYCLCESFARVTERAALAGARWLGRADQEAAEEAAVSGARFALQALPVSGRVGIRAPPGAQQLGRGPTIRAGGGEGDLPGDPPHGGAAPPP